MGAVGDFLDDLVSDSGIFPYVAGPPDPLSWMGNLATQKLSQSYRPAEAITEGIEGYIAPPEEPPVEPPPDPAIAAKEAEKEAERKARIRQRRLREGGRVSTFHSVNSPSAFGTTQEFLGGY